MSKFKLFIENFFVYGLGGIINKIIPLIMVPIITRLMQNSSYYGINDLLNTILSFGSALAIMGMYDAMYRMFFEKDDEEYKKDICSTAFIFNIITSFIIFGVMILFKDFLADKVLGDKQYGYLVYITAIATLIGATNSIVSAPTRMQNKRGVFLVMNTLSPVLSYSVSIPLLLSGYYVIALPVAGLISAIISELFFWIINHNWFSFKRFNFKYLKQMLIIAVPLIPNFLIYWIFNSSDRLMITNILGVEATGIYSVGSKLGQASQLIYTAFATGWQYFAFSTMKDNNQVKTNSKIYEYLSVISFICTFFICALSRPVFELLFDKEYVSGYIVSPYLFLAPLLQMLFQVACNQFIIVKKTWPNIFILSSGAVINIIMNLWLIPILNIEGAAIATLIGYAISNAICIIVLKCMNLMEISKRFIFVVLSAITYILLWRLFLKDYILVSVLLALLIMAVYILVYKKDIMSLIAKKK